VSAVAETAQQRRSSFPTFTYRGRGPPTPAYRRALPTFSGCRHRQRRHSAAVCQTDTQAASHHSQSPRTSEIQKPAPLPARLSRTYMYRPQMSHNRPLSFLRNEHAAERRVMEMLFFLWHQHEGTLIARLQLHADVTRSTLAGARSPSWAGGYRDRGGTMSRLVKHTQKQSHTSRRALLHQKPYRQFHYRHTFFASTGTPAGRVRIAFHSF